MPDRGSPRAGKRTPANNQDGKPHYLGHRERLRRRLIDRGGDALADYEVLEVLLFAGNPRRDVKPLAKGLLQRFGTLSAVLAAAPSDLKAVEGIGESTVASLIAVHEASRRATREQAMDQPVIASWDRLLAYCRVTMAEQKVEQFRVLYLNRKNHLIADEPGSRGTVDQTAVYPREVVKRALELSASAIILVHNHPSGDPTPSKADIQMTRDVSDAAERLGIVIHDHVVITRSGHASFKSMGLL